MKHVKQHLKLQELDFHIFHIIDSYFSDSSLFLDIETTGFSASYNQCYLIGTAYRTEDSICLEQFFAEAKQEEPLILKEFSKLLENYQTVIFFNGKAFDLPFLKKRMDYHNLQFVYDNKHYVDLLKVATSLRNIFQLENYRQKTVEEYLGIHREDIYSEKDLIPIYLDYEKSPNTSSLQVLLKHNFDDVLGLARLLSLFSYTALFEGAFDLLATCLQDYRTFTNEIRTEFYLEARLHTSLPKPFSCQNEWVYCTAKDDKMTLRVFVEQGELKYFYPDYKNYYYLPEEDLAIHKSVAAYVERTHRIKATRQTCYGKKNGTFLPQWEEFQKPAFYKKYQDTVCYFKYTEDCAILKQYGIYLLNILLSSAPH